MTDETDVVRKSSGVDTKIAVIAGASSSIGAARTDRLHQQRWTVIGASRRATSSGPWRGLTMDVDDDASAKEGVAHVIAQHRAIHTLIACAGWGVAGAGELRSMKDAKAQFEPNFWGNV